MSNLGKIIRTQVQLNGLAKGLPGTVGKLAVNFFKDNFRRQAFSGEDRWPERKPSDLPVVKYGRKKRRKGNRFVLVQTGVLRRSIRILYKSDSQVMVGTTLRYASVHNKGGVIKQSVQPTPRMVRFFWANHYAAKKAGDEEAAEKWKRRAISKKPINRTIRIPQRKFIGHSPRLNKQIILYITKGIISATR